MKDIIEKDQAKYKNHHILTDKKWSTIKMWLSLVLIYTMITVGTISNYFLLQWVRNNPYFNAETADLRLVAFEFVDSLH